MNYKQLIKEQNLSSFPIGILSNQVIDNDSESIQYDLIVFDEKPESSKILEYDGYCVRIHHASISENQPKKLLQYCNLEIIQDESWELRMFISKIQDNIPLFYSDLTKNCLIESLFYCQKTRDAINTSDVFGPCWQKCASFLLANALSSFNHEPFHSFQKLNSLRNLPQNSINEHVSVATQTIGIERATPTLLNRMLKSTIGFSDQVENNNHSQIIQKNHGFFVKNSMLTDCYFYLGHVNKENFLKIKNHLKNHKDLIHILKTAFDIEVDATLLSQNVDLIQKSCNILLEKLSQE